MLPDHCLPKSGNTRCHPNSGPVPVMTNHDEHPEMQGQAQKKRKTERQGQAQKQAAGVLEEFEEDEVNDDPPEGPNFDTRPWFWAHRLPTKKAAPMPPFENVAAQRPEGARLPSVGLVLFLEAMTDLIGQINVENAEEEWNSESIERIKQVPTELKTKLNDRAHMIKWMSCWQSFLTAMETHGPKSKRDTWLSCNKVMDDSGPDIIELTTD